MHRDQDEDLAPLLRDPESGVSSKPKARRRWPKFTIGRYPLAILVGITFFIVGYLAHSPSSIPTRLRWTKNPNLDKAVRVRLLNELLQERYPKSAFTKARTENFDALDRLASCIKQGSCGPGEETVLLLASYHFGRAEDGGTSGEDVWARSTIKAFHELNHTMLLTYGHMDTLMIYQHLSDMVPMIFWEEHEFLNCLKRNETNHAQLEAEENSSPGDWQKGKKACIQSPEFPEGIPMWKSFAFMFWNVKVVPLGALWSVSPEDYENIQADHQHTNYLGYSIEERCNNYPYYSEREHRALILAKETKYFEEEHNKFFGQLAEARDGVPPLHTEHGDVKFELVSTAGKPKGGGGPEPLDEPGLESLGRLTQPEWTELLARGKALLGIGLPFLSPSSYYGLCLGVPFINVVFHVDDNHPDNRTHWETQQNALRFIEEPYVYHVREHDKDGLRDALTRAANTPIERYIPPNMRWGAVLERHRKLLAMDWLAEAKRVVAEDFKNDPAYAYMAMDPPGTNVTDGAKAMPSGKQGQRRRA